MVSFPKLAQRTSAWRRIVRSVAPTSSDHGSTTASDTLKSARRLKAAGIEPEHAEAIAVVMGLYFSQPRRATAEGFDAQTASLRAASIRPHARPDAVHRGLRTRIGAGKAESAARRDAVQFTMLSESPVRTDSARTGRWWDCIDVEVGVVWFMTLTTILACAFTLLQFI